MATDPNQELEVLHALFEPLLELGQQKLRRYGVVAPVGMARPVEGNDRLIAVDGEDARTMVEMLRSGLGKGLRDRSLLAVGMVYEVTMRGEGDALCVDLEHQNGECIRLLVPYRKGFLRKFKFSPVVQVPVGIQLFSDASSEHEAPLQIDTERFIRDTKGFIVECIDAFVVEHRVAAVAPDAVEPLTREIAKAVVPQMFEPDSGHGPGLEEWLEHEIEAIALERLAERGLLAR